MNIGITVKVLRNGAMALLALGMLPVAAAAAGHGAEGGAYMSVDFGSSRLDARATDYDAFAMQAAGEGPQVNVLESRFDRSDTGWSLVVFGMQERHLGFELGYQKLGTMSWEGTLGVDDGEGQSQLPVAVGISSRGWSLSAAGIWAINERLQLEGRAGAYFGKSRTTALFTVEGPGTVEISDKDSSISAMLGGSIVYSVGRHSSLSLGYTWFNDVAGKRLERLSLGYRLFLMKGSP